MAGLYAEIGTFRLPSCRVRHNATNLLRKLFQGKGEPRSITQAELQKIIDLEIGWENYHIVCDLFVFSSSTGLAISDVRNLREESLVMEEGTGIPKNP